MKIVLDNKHNKINILYLDNGNYVPLFNNPKNTFLLSNIELISEYILTNEDYKILLSTNYSFYSITNLHEKLLPLLDFKSNKYKQTVNSADYLIEFRKKDVIYGYYFLLLRCYKLSNSYIWSVFEDNISDINDFDKHDLIEKVVKLLLVEHFKMDSSDVLKITKSL